MGDYWSKKEEKPDQPNTRKRPAKVAMSGQPYRQQPYVLKRVSSMFLDEDEDLAHEFYEEYRILDHAESVVRWTMRRIKNNLRPQGEISLKNPRLHVDFPVLLVENAT